MRQLWASIKRTLFTTEKIAMTIDLHIPPFPRHVRRTPSDRLRQIASDLAADIERGDFKRVRDNTRMELRGLAMTLDIIAEEIEAAAPLPDRRRAWWRRWF